MLVLDDSVVKRNRSKAVELLARVYDHAEHKYQKGFTMLTLGWSDGYSFVPVGFNLLSSAKKSNRYQEISDQIDHRTNGYKARKESLLSKPEAAIRLICKALAAGIQADYVLMDTWFTTEPMLANILETGPDVIGMVKQLKQRYSYRGKLYTLPELRRFVRYDNSKNIFGSIVVSTKTGIPVKIVIVRNRNKKSTDLDTEKVKQAMQQLADLKLFVDKDKHPLYEVPMGARYVTTTDHVLFDNKPAK